MWRQFCSGSLHGASNRMPPLTQLQQPPSNSTYNHMYVIYRVLEQITWLSNDTMVNIMAFDSWLKWVFSELMSCWCWLLTWFSLLTQSPSLCSLLTIKHFTFIKFKNDLNKKSNVEYVWNNIMCYHFGYHQFLNLFN